MTARHVPEWWEDRLNLVALIGWGDEVGEFQSVSQVEHFVEKPWLYEDLWREMRDSLVPRRGERQDERRSSL